MDLTGLEREDLVEIINNQAAFIAELEAKLAKTDNVITKKAEPESKPTLPSSPVDVLGKLYKFRYPSFRFGGELHRADKAQYDLPLMERIVKSGLPIMYEVS